MTPYPLAYLLINLINCYLVSRLMSYYIHIVLPFVIHLLADGM